MRLCKLSRFTKTGARAHAHEVDTLTRHFAPFAAAPHRTYCHHRPMKEQLAAAHAPAAADMARPIVAVDVDEFVAPAAAGVTPNAAKVGQVVVSKLLEGA